MSLAHPINENDFKSHPETDPLGKGQHESGAKLDAGKNRLGLVLGGFPRALAEVGKVGTYGANKYSDNGWMEVPNGEARYSDAMLRHVFKRFEGEIRDEDTGISHLAHAAWNALATLELALRRSSETAERMMREAGAVAIGMSKPRTVTPPYGNCIAIDCANLSAEEIALKASQGHALLLTAEQYRYLCVPQTPVKSDAVQPGVKTIDETITEYYNDRSRSKLTPGAVSHMSQADLDAAVNAPGHRRREHNQD